MPLITCGPTYVNIFDMEKHLNLRKTILDLDFSLMIVSGSIIWRRWTWWCIRIEFTLCSISINSEMFTYFNKIMKGLENKMEEWKEGRSIENYTHFCCILLKGILDRFKVSTYFSCSNTYGISISSRLHIRIWHRLGHRYATDGRCNEVVQSESSKFRYRKSFLCRRKI